MQFNAIRRRSFTSNSSSVSTLSLNCCNVLSNRAASATDTVISTPGAAVSAPTGSDNTSNARIVFTYAGALVPPRVSIAYCRADSLPPNTVSRYAHSCTLRVGELRNAFTAAI